MDYFKYFPTIDYMFGDHAQKDKFRNISIYTDVIDQVKDNLTMYEDYNILDGERPDNVSQKIYDTPEYHWTFYMLNDKIREKGWPLTQKKLYEFALRKYPFKVMNLSIDISTILKVGQTITGVNNGATAKIIHRDTDLLQLVLTDVNGNITSTQGYQTINADGSTTTIAASDVSSIVDQINATHHIENTSGEHIDLIDSNGDFVLGTGDIPVTNLEELVRVNDSLKQIRVFRPGNIDQIADAFKQAIKI